MEEAHEETEEAHSDWAEVEVEALRKEALEAEQEAVVSIGQLGQLEEVVVEDRHRRGLESEEEELHACTGL